MYLTKLDNYLEFMNQKAEKLYLGDFYAESAKSVGSGKHLYELGLGWNAPVSASLHNPYKLEKAISTIFESPSRSQSPIQN